MLRYTHSPLLSGNNFHVHLEKDALTLEGAAKQTLRINQKHDYKADINEEAVLIILEALFGSDTSLEEITFNDKTITRSHFYQSPLLWLRSKSEEEKISHPLRPPLFHGVHYKRYIPSLRRTISFRTISINDLDIFHEWHNQKRVSFFWELNKSKAELEQYILEGLQKKHQIPMIVEFDGEPVGYYEFYWVMEDRLGPYYEARQYDRGFHFLVGNKKFLGKDNTNAITQSGLHFIYLDDLRTDFVMAEPRYDNKKVLKYADETIGWDALKIFDFPHKRAVLLQNSRDRFFKGAKL